MFNPIRAFNMLQKHPVAMFIRGSLSFELEIS
jgi:hypothetical protein